MLRILLASHGKLAAGMYDTLHLFYSDFENIEYICGYIDDESLEHKIEAYFSGIPSEDEIVVITDLFGGSVNTKFVEYQKYNPKKKIYLIAGMNLGLMMEVLMLDNNENLKTSIRKIIENSRDSIVYMNDYEVENEIVDEV